ncbi:capsule biosynthesis protein [Rhodoblastus acidophilus]|uniref:Capsule biosynthesis protein n=1 Tax=Candidatus Rhodoblastus alkanivorans TaxID=2954117 RepID=A0ABS9Z3L5_9HYPH|nr:capsule biosynthesis protein [Candidatus Rhodoblastus alkanivorans]MCI4677321.1 capsule biosynthesis protein [Candidatus Rhodoblastus alkanivorans]MCI4682056.1 capsule biosynthesis protein [Candidatus Rhodoblastus alkanivorans]MDI4639358.1 capsule biosynthesis protein [Rhodoblastus acidophilus]
MGNILKPKAATGLTIQLDGSLAQRAAGAALKWAPASRRSRLYILAVMLPTLWAMLYYGLIASKRYVSEAQFVVRSVSSQRLSGLQMFFRSFGLSPAADDANAVESYLQSRDAVRALAGKLPLREMFGRKEADVFARFPHFYLWPRNSFERLYDYYLERVTVVRDPTTGITDLRVIAFDPRDAQEIAQELLQLAEAMVNRMNARAEKDAVKSSLDDLAMANARLAASQKSLAAYRKEAQFLDPASTSASILETITSLSSDLASATALAEEMKKTSPANPAIFSMSQKINSLRDAIDAERQKIAGGDRAVAAKLARYEQLLLDEKLAETGVEAANVSLEVARQDARKQSIYVEEVVEPNLADESTEPQRLRMIATVFVLSFAIFGVIWLLVAGTKEHVVR